MFIVINVAAWVVIISVAYVMVKIWWQVLGGCIYIVQLISYFELLDRTFIYMTQSLGTLYDPVIWTVQN